MKYLILIGDGMADRPLPELGGRTPLDAADTPHLDFLAARGRLGTAVTIPPAAPEPGSDVGNMSIMGYDPVANACGRGPLEAANIGVDLGPEDVAFRCNLVSLAWEGEKPTGMADHSAGHITTEEGCALLEAVRIELGRPGLEFHAGISFRHLLVWRRGPDGTMLHPPHDFRGAELVGHWPAGPGAEILTDLIKRSWPVLRNHPINKARAKEGKATADSVWFWGQGRPPRLTTIPARFGLSGVVISAVDLINGLGRLAGLEVVRVPGATGYLDSNLRGKAEAALAALDRCDLALVHVEAPDECGHEGDLAKKIRAIELFDAEVVGPALAGLEKLGPHRILALPDHYTPLEIKTHSREPVPFALYDSSRPAESDRRYTEVDAARGDWLGLPGPGLIELLLDAEA